MVSISHSLVIQANQPDFESRTRLLLAVPAAWLWQLR
jgi:hypothetical protein